MNCFETLEYGRKIKGKLTLTSSYRCCESSRNEKFFRTFHEIQLVTMYNLFLFHLSKMTHFSSHTSSFCCFCLLFQEKKNWEEKNRTIPKIESVPKERFTLQILNWILGINRTKHNWSSLGVDVEMSSEKLVDEALYGFCGKNVLKFIECKICFKIFHSSCELDCKRWELWVKDRLFEVPRKINPVKNWLKMWRCSLMKRISICSILIN